MHELSLIQGLVEACSDCGVDVEMDDVLSRWPGSAAWASGLLLAAHAGWKAGRREVLRRHGLLAGVALLAVVLLWASYGLRFHAVADGSDAFNHPRQDGGGQKRPPRRRIAGRLP